MRRFLLAIASMALAGCGYVGDPLPPALNIPEPVADLRVLQRADRLILDYTAPSLTTEAIGLTSITSAEAQVGDRTVPIEPPKPGEAGHAELPAADWTRQEVAVKVILGGPKGRKSAASNTVIVRVLEPLHPPDALKAEPHPEGVRVSWTDAKVAGARYRVTRIPDANSIVDKPEFIDRAVEIGKEYRYSITTVVEHSESLPSPATSVVARDTFAPAIPSNLTAIAGVNSVELAWDRVIEPDLKHYRLYRDGQPIGDPESPSFSDKQIKSGQRYRYELTAIDQAGNESVRSMPIEIVAP